MSGLERVRATLAAYERWADSYPPAPHNPLMRAEQEAMLAALPEIRGKRVLDLACGTGRYAALLRRAGAREVVAADFSSAMLARVADGWRVRADLAQLPFRDAAFDAVVSGLALSHAASFAGCVAEIARVLRPGGALLYSDFHEAAASAGLTRSFRDGDNRSHTVPDASLSVGAHYAALMAAGFRVDALRELRVGFEVRDVFPGSDAFYGQWHGTPLVLVVRATR